VLELGALAGTAERDRVALGGRWPLPAGRVGEPTTQESSNACMDLASVFPMSLGWLLGCVGQITMGFQEIKMMRDVH